MSVRSLRITKLGIHATLLAALCLAPAGLLAHGSGKHVRGYVEKLSSESITVKTTAGKIVEAAVGTKTTYTRGDHAIQKADIRAGDRIVIHATEVNGKLVAHTVQIGTASAGKQPAKR
jgi:hypothetical protein